MKNNILKTKFLALIFLIAYIALLIKVLVLKELPMLTIGQVMLDFGGTHEGPGNFVPFKTILPYLMGEKGLIIGGTNIVGNIALLIPTGFLLPFILQHFNWKKCRLFALAAGLSLEAMQVLLHVGIFDIDDVILNGLGVMIGYWSFIHLSRKIIIITAIFVAIGALYTFQHLQTPTTFNPRQTDSSKTSLPEEDIKILNATDPCNGTGGTGEIITVENNSLTIRLNNGAKETLFFTVHTTIRNSLGPVQLSTLKPGDRITVVTGRNSDGSSNVTLILVCNIQNR